MCLERLNEGVESPNSNWTMRQVSCNASRNRRHSPVRASEVGLDIGRKLTEVA
jgi:hypothetical protein